MYMVIIVYGSLMHVEIVGSISSMTVLLSALKWNLLSIVVTPGTAENVLISEVPSF